MFLNYKTLKLNTWFGTSRWATKIFNGIVGIPWRVWRSNFLFRLLNLARRTITTTTTFLNSPHFDTMQYSQRFWIWQARHETPISTLGTKLSNVGFQFVIPANWWLVMNEGTRPRWASLGTNLPDNVDSPICDSCWLMIKGKVLKPRSASLGTN